MTSPATVSDTLEYDPSMIYRSRFWFWIVEPRNKPKENKDRMTCYQRFSVSERSLASFVALHSRCSALPCLALQRREQRHRHIDSSRIPCSFETWTSTTLTLFSPPCVFLFIPFFASSVFQCLVTLLGWALGNKSIHHPVSLSFYCSAAFVANSPFQSFR